MIGDRKLVANKQGAVQIGWRGDVKGAWLVAHAIARWAEVDVE